MDLNSLPPVVRGHMLTIVTKMVTLSKDLYDDEQGGGDEDGDAAFGAEEEDDEEEDEDEEDGDEDEEEGAEDGEDVDDEEDLAYMQAIAKQAKAMHTFANAEEYENVSVVMQNVNIQHPLSGSETVDPFDAFRVFYPGF